MDLLDAIRVRVLRKPLPGAKPSDAMPPAATLEELHGLHAQLLTERAAARTLVLDAPERRDALLEEPGTDAAIRRLDREVATAHLTVASQRVV